MLNSPRFVKFKLPNIQVNGIRVYTKYKVKRMLYLKLGKRCRSEMGSAIRVALSDLAFYLIFIDN